MVNGGGKMVVEVWSDVMCPYCYMGARMLQDALAGFPHRDRIDVVWRSYQLYPDLKTDTGSDIYQLLAKRGFDRPTIMRAHQELREKGARLGIEFNFSKVVIANTFNAHRMLHHARRSGKQTGAHELLFKAHFTDGRNVDDASTLVSLGEEIGLDREELAEVLRCGAHAEAVRADIEEARDLGIEAVPHFMFDRNEEVIGAEGAPLLAQTLDVAFRDWSAKGG